MHRKSLCILLKWPVPTSTYFIDPFYIECQPGVLCSSMLAFCNTCSNFCALKWTPFLLWKRLYLMIRQQDYFSLYVMQSTDWELEGGGWLLVYSTPTPTYTKLSTNNNINGSPICYWYHYSNYSRLIYSLMPVLCNYVEMVLQYQFLGFPTYNMLQKQLFDRNRLISASFRRHLEKLRRRLYALLKICTSGIHTDIWDWMFRLEKLFVLLTLTHW